MAAIKQMSIAKLLGYLVLCSWLTSANPVQALSLTFVNPGDANTTPGHPAQAWTDLQKQIVNFALDEWQAIYHKVLPGGAWTVRWEDGDLFKNWPGVDNYTNAAGLTVYPGWKWSDNGGTAQDDLDFPGGEIYFNTTVDWFFDPTVNDDSEFDVQGGQAWKLTAKPSSAAAGKWDFLSVAKHELGHAIGLGHLTGGQDGVMDSWGIGDRRHISPADQTAFNNLVPEPGSLSLLLLGFGGIACLAVVGPGRKSPRLA